MRLRKDGVRPRFHRKWCFMKELFFIFVTTGFLVPWIFMYLLESQPPLSLPKQETVKDTLTSFMNRSGAEDAEPDIASWWRAVIAERNNVSVDNDCESFLAPKGMSISLLPACQVPGGTKLSKPFCSKEGLDVFVNGGGSTKAHCVKRGLQSKCYVENIILKNGNFFTYKGTHSGIPSTIYVADGARGPLMSNHKYRGTPVREIAPPAELRPSILNHCKYVVNQPVVFIFRMSGHSTYHLWENNLGPFFATLYDDFGIPNRGKRREKKSGSMGRNNNNNDNNNNSGVFDGQVPLIITVDHKPRNGTIAPRLLDELLHYFTNTPILDAAELAESTCFAKAVIGISSGSFKQGALRHWLFPRIALRYRLMQLHRETYRSASYPSSARNTNVDSRTLLRCLVPYDHERKVPQVVGRWFMWKLRQWRRKPSQPSVLYLSRNHPKITRGRKVVNEADVLPALEATVLQLTGKPLRRIFLEEMSYIDQIMTMSEINILIAPHGGGIANCVWMPPGSIVLEFVAPVGATLPNMYHAMCRRRDGAAGVRAVHIPFVAEQDPAEREPGFAEANVMWNSNRRLFSNIWMPKEKLLEHVHRSVELYRAALMS